MRAGPPRDSLALGEASRRLGVHPDTLRRWADTARVPAWVTPGGHRRFPRSVIERLTARIGGDPAVGRVAAGLPADARARFRRRGERMLRLLQAHARATTDDERATRLAAAEREGAAYGREALDLGIPLATAIALLAAVRRHLVRELPAGAPAFDRVLIAVVTAYALGARRSGATIDPAAW